MNITSIMKNALSTNLLSLIIVYSSSNCKTVCAQQEVESSICTNNLFTQSIFDAIAPLATAPYSYTGFCNAVNNWNKKNNPSLVIFSGERQKDEFAAFLAHALHESHDFKAAREYSQCETYTTDSFGKAYCKPVGYTGGSYIDPYCSLQHTPTSNPDGCACAPMVYESTNMPGFIEADNLFFGRGPLQTSWNYNYKDLHDALLSLEEDTYVDICATPDLLATNEEYAWISAFLFWTTNTGTVGMTSSEAVVEGSSFGSTVKVINGGLECPALPGYESSVWERLNDYCIAASALGVEALLSLDGCSGLEEQFEQCLMERTCPACVVWEGRVGMSSSSGSGGGGSSSIPTPGSSSSSSGSEEGRPTPNNASLLLYSAPQIGLIAILLLLSHLL